MMGGHIERDQAAERGAGDGGVVAIGLGAIFAVDEGLDLFDHESRVQFAASACVAGGVGAGGVFVHAGGGVKDADDDNRLDAAGLNEALGCFVRLPLDAEE